MAKQEDDIFSDGDKDDVFSQSTADSSLPSEPLPDKAPVEKAPTLDDKEVKAVAARAMILAKEDLDKKASERGSKEWYRKNGSRRWVCRVNSNQRNVDTFETVIENPRTGQPEAILVKCGVIIKVGLPLAAIKEAKTRSYTYTEEIVPDPLALQGLTHKMVSRPMYSVEVFNEVENPLPIGRAGQQQPVMSSDEAFA